jgi:hypothetical protein
MDEKRKGAPHLSRHCITTFLGSSGLRVAALALLLGMTAGCWSSRPVVEGTVTLDGEPIEKGTIELLPSDGKGPTAGCGIEAGKYRMPAAPGSRQVVIRASRKDGQMPDPMSPGSGAMVDRYVSYVPEKYNDKTELTVTIKPGLNQHDFKLEGGPRPTDAR